MQDIPEWLHSIGMERYERLFVAHAIDPSFLSDLTDADLKEIGIEALGHRKTILREARRTLRRSMPAGLLGAETPPRATEQALADTSGADPDPERRHLTVMFCDMVGSTRLSQELDPEDLRQVILAFQETAEESITRYGGHTAQHLGDGLLAYFGYPVAHEDDAARAAMAALDIVDSLSVTSDRLEPEFGTRLAVRIGIHSGMVVVGRMGYERRTEALATGEVPNLAARLQSAAHADSVLVSGQTRHLLRQQFELEFLGSRTFPGSIVPVDAFHLVSENPRRSRYQGRHLRHVATMIGRDSERRALVFCWQSAERGRGCLVAVSGEAGIGKSRLVQALADGLPRDAATVILCQCVPYHSNTTLFPITRYLESASGITLHDDELVRLEKLQGFLGESARGCSGGLQFIARLFDIERVFVDRHGASEMEPQVRRKQALRLLVDHMLSLADRRPLLLIIEDVHWIDPTTIELVRILATELAERRLLIVLTIRSERQRPLGVNISVETIELTRMSPECIRLIVQQAAGGAQLDHALATQIVARSDGIPLFAEELTMATLESDIASGSTMVHGSNDSGATVPATLRDALFERLDRLGDAKAIAQHAACIGREFSRRELEKLLELPKQLMSNGLRKLMDAGLIEYAGEQPENSLVFRHSLIRDVAHDSLLRSQRRDLHGKLLAIYQEPPAAPPQLRAHHAQQANLFESASALWEEAGDQAFSQRGTNEAVAFFRHAIETTGATRATGDQAVRELELTVKLCHALSAAVGYVHPDTIEANDAALHLLRDVPDSPHRFSIFHASWTAFLMSGQQDRAIEVASRMYSAAIDSCDDVRAADAARFLGWSNFLRGELSQSLRNFEISLAHYDPAPDDPQVLRYGTDAWIALKCFHASPLLLSGRATEAWEVLKDVEARARSEGSLPTMGWTLVNLCRIHGMARSAHFERLALEVVDFVERHDLKGWFGTAYAYKADALVLRGDLDGAVDLMERGIDSMRQGGHRILASSRLAAFAVALYITGQESRAREIENEVRRLIETGSEHSHDAENLRMFSAVHWKQHRDSAGARRDLGNALEISRKQGAWLWQARIAIDLARLLAADGEKELALSSLRQVVDDFPASGRCLRDYRDALGLLHEMSERD